MKLLLDECVVQDLRHLLPGHEVFTVAYLGWSGTKNGALLTKASADGFDALITTDQKIEHEQNPNTLPLAVIILVAISNDFDDLALLVPELLRILPTLKPKTIVRIGR